MYHGAQIILGDSFHEEVGLSLSIFLPLSLSLLAPRETHLKREVGFHRDYCARGGFIILQHARYSARTRAASLT